MTNVLKYCARVGLIQLMQYYYQSGSLYRLRALGERRTMDITVGMSTIDISCVTTKVNKYSRQAWQLRCRHDSNWTIALWYRFRAINADKCEIQHFRHGDCLAE